MELLKEKYKTGESKVILNTENIYRVIKTFLGTGTIDKKIIDMYLGGSNDNLSIILIQTKIQEKCPYFIKLNKEMTIDALQKLKYENQTE